MLLSEACWIIYINSAFRFFADKIMMRLHVLGQAPGICAGHAGETAGVCVCVCIDVSEALCFTDNPSGSPPCSSCDFPRNGSLLPVPALIQVVRFPSSLD